VFPVRYELGSYIPKDGILHSHRRENLNSYIDYNELVQEWVACFYILAIVIFVAFVLDRLCGLVVRVPGC
jgi:hypothetical protein